MRGKGSNSPPLNSSKIDTSHAKGKSGKQPKGNNSILEGSFTMKQGWGTQGSDSRKKVPGKKPAQAKKRAEPVQDQDWIGAE